MTDEIYILKVAAEASPDDVPLRRLLAGKLLAAGRDRDAESEFIRVLASGSGCTADQVGLARAFAAQGKEAEAGLLLEEAAERADCPAQGWALYAKFLCRQGKLPRAQEFYRKAVRAEPALADALLEADLRLDRVAAPARGAGRDAPASSPAEKPCLSFKDVGGMEGVKEEIRRKILYPLAHPQLYSAYGKAAGGGVLLYGPPGCGKTYLCRAAAGEARLAFISVELHEILDMWLGESEKNMHRIFETARRSAPCVLVFDEADALGAGRSDVSGAGRTVINQFLSELDGMASKNSGILVLGTTNAPWDVDPGFRRPGRFDRVLFVPPPDAKAREEIFKVHLRDKPLEDIAFAGLAEITEGYSGADIKAVCDVAVDAKVETSLHDQVIVPLTTRDLREAAREVRPSVGEWLAAARNHALYSNAGGRYDDVLRYMGLRSCD